MNTSSLRELGQDLLDERQFEKALAVFAEAVRRVPNDHRSRMDAARCLAELGETERAVSALHACAEGLLRRDYLLSAIAACKLALNLSPTERRIKETLARVHSRAVRAAPGKAAVPPPLPPESLYDGKVDTDLMGLQGQQLSDKAFEVLAHADDSGQSADPNARPPLPLFAELEQAAFIDLVALMTARVAKPDEKISGEGEGGDTLYVIAAGKGEVTRNVAGEKKTIGILGGGSIFGELSLLTGTPPTATVTAVADTEVFEIKREHLNALSRKHASVMPSLAHFAQQRMARNLMATSPIFQPIPERDRAALLGRFKFKALAPSERVIEEGQYAPGLFMVLAGELVVQKEDPTGGVVSLGILREGDICGEISLLKGLRATATVLSTRKTATAFLERNEFDALVKEFPHTREYLEGLSERRLKMIGEAMRPAEIIDADELVFDEEKTVS